MTKAIGGAIHSLDPNLPLADVKTIQQIVRDQYEEDRFGMALYGSLAGVALVLASLGIYGVMSFAVAQSTPEIGVRIALGANTSDVMRRVLKRGLAMAGAGLALGSVGAYVTARAMESSLYGTGRVDWTAFSAVAVLFVIAALLACYVPARRASSVDPVAALREG
jgi:putative ABC transport system permease protein